MEKSESLIVRPTLDIDVEALSILLNEIIEIGGSTAMEFPITAAEFSMHYLSGPDFICCHVAVGKNGELLGFQSLTRNAKLARNWADIATFARVSPKVRGVGTAMFQETKKHARQHAFLAINATIRADNVSGLAYYSKMGFENYFVIKAVPLSDGTPIDRISKKFTL